MTAADVFYGVCCIFVIVCVLITAIKSLIDYLRS